MPRKIAHFYPVEETNNLEKLKEKPVIVYNSDKHDMCILWIIYLIFPSFLAWLRYRAESQI